MVHLQDQYPQEDLSLPQNHTGVVLVQSLESLKKKKRITDFHSWTEAFMVFVAAKYRSTAPVVAIWRHAQSGSQGILS